MYVCIYVCIYIHVYMYICVYIELLAFIYVQTSSSFARSSLTSSHPSAAAEPWTLLAIWREAAAETRCSLALPFRCMFSIDDYDSRMCSLGSRCSLALPFRCMFSIDDYDSRMCPLGSRCSLALPFRNKFSIVTCTQYVYWCTQLVRVLVYFVRVLVYFVRVKVYRLLRKPCVTFHSALFLCRRGLLIFFFSVLHFQWRRSLKGR